MAISIHVSSLKKVTVNCVISVLKIYQLISSKITHINSSNGINSFFETDQFDLASINHANILLQFLELILRFSAWKIGSSYLFTCRISNIL